MQSTTICSSAGLPSPRISRRTLFRPAGKFQRIHHLDSGCQWYSHGSAIDNRRSRSLDRGVSAALTGPGIIERTADEIYDATQQRFSNRHVEHAKKSIRIRAGGKAGSFVEENDSDSLWIEVECHPEQIVAKADQFFGADARQALVPGQHRDRRT